LTLRRFFEELSILDAIKDWHISHPKIKNVLLFVSDALRWDHTPKEVRSMGVTFKTIASGIWTPISFPSIISGEYQPRHGVYNFHSGELPNDSPTLLNIDGYNSSIWTENIWTRFDPPTSAPIYDILSCKHRASLKDLKTPFIYLEDEKGGHCPYGWSFDDKEYEEWDVFRFYSDFVRKDIEELRKRYRTGVQRSLNEFQNRLKIIENRGLWDETLVIFLSDHGELLGEYGGIFGHGDFTAPEIVYVPTVLIHPDLPKGVTCEHEGVLRHVDLYPTICSIIGRRIPAVDGLSLINMEKLPAFGFTYHVEKVRTLRQRKCTFEEISLWDKDGGHVFRTGISKFQKLYRALYFTAFSQEPTALYQRHRMRRFPWMIKDYESVVSHYYKFHIEYGSPSLKENEARLIVEKAKLDDNRFREKQRIIATIKRMSAERPI
jgi:hypothetical protein